MPRLETVDFWLEAAPGPLLPQVRSALAERGEALRWAITVALPAEEGSQLLLRRLRIEAVLLQIP
ncbi:MULTISPECIES: hypothetical protein [unclassified Synechococcus]|uniref:hypothetical protein n=1 Tax=unclassified Synechococcus TaxID=2626047 RepID=UPI000069937D|nr:MULTISPECIES: hypothetical protein [unclassified Synechococcus]EAQ76169.1 hypothetical protein WH5701_15221 [Synechococcus sp. WH 5701]WFN58875.1 hypothetical protein N4320_14015 [Synechococcus sp. CCFWC 502]